MSEATFLVFRKNEKMRKNVKNRGAKKPSKMTAEMTPGGSLKSIFSGPGAFFKIETRPFGAQKLLFGVSVF